MNSSFSLYASTKQLSRKVIVSGNGHSTVPASFSWAMLLLGSFYPQHVCSRINLPTELILSCHLHLSHWHIASLQYVWFLDASLNDAQLSVTSFNLWQKVSGSLSWSTPQFFYIYTRSKASFWGPALLGNDWGLNRPCLTMACSLSCMSALPCWCC